MHLTDTNPRYSIEVYGVKLLWTCKANMSVCIEGNAGKIIMLLWSLELDSDRWITKWTGAISFPSRVCSQGLFLSFVWRCHQNNTPTILCFHSLHPEKLLSQRSNSLTENPLMQCDRYFFMRSFLLLSPSPFHNPKHPLLTPTHSQLSFRLVWIHRAELLRSHSNDTRNPLITWLLTAHKKHWYLNCKHPFPASIL